jgi:hypothetical protein
MKLAEICSLANPDAAAAALQEHVAGEVYPRSVSPIADGAGVIFMARQGREKQVHMLGKRICVEGRECLAGEAEKRDVDGETLFLRSGDLDEDNAAAVRSLLPHLVPQPLGTATSVGLGDRLGLATPGHVRAVRGTGVRPVFAQQSMREMERTGRAPQQVLDDATFGALQAGWDEGYGADGDHLKTTADIDACLAAGFTLFTVDPGEHVEDAADALEVAALEERYAALPWEALETGPEECRTAYAGREVALPDETLAIEPEELLRAAVKYGGAVAHTAALYRHLVEAAGDRPVELEVSVDETETPTSPAAHYYVAAELQRLGVSIVSLAPRFVGRFEKGVEYKGEVADFAASFRRHVAVARALGPYKISLHSGSDKFSLYPVIAEAGGGLVHVKTAGTSYLEALRAVSRIDPELFGEILAHARERYPEDRRSYCVSADPGRVPDPETATPEDLGAVLDQPDARQVLHVTYGSILTATDADGEYRFRDRLYATLEAFEDAAYACLEAHLRGHVQPFS